MSQRAGVSSIEALESFRASLLVYLDKAGGFLDEVTDEIARTRVWLEMDRLAHWKRRVHQCGKAAAQAEQELLTARLAGLPEAIKGKRLALDRAKAALAEAEARRGKVKLWMRQYETQVASPAKKVAQLRELIAHDMRKAAGFLEGALGSLAGYTESSRASVIPGSRTAAERDSAPAGERPERAGSEPGETEPGE